MEYSAKLVAVTDKNMRKFDIEYIGPDKIEIGGNGGGGSKPVKPLLEKMFDGEDYNALMSAFWDLAGSKDEIYTWIENTPKTSMVVEIVAKLKEFGYEIKKINV